MKNILIISSLFLICYIAKSQEAEFTPDDFGIKASVYVKKLCEFGERGAGTAAEIKTIDYLTNEFKSVGMKVVIDTLTYRFYYLDDRTILINNCKIPIKTAFINCPISDTVSFESHCMKLTNTNEKDNLSNKIVFTSSSVNSILLTRYKPKAIFVLEQRVFDTLKINIAEKYKVTLLGHSESEWIKSYNIIATYKYDFPIDSTIVLTAHWDSKNGVGAGDNASGTAALIELSKFFSTRLKNLKYSLTFIATGAEETGLTGAISYVLNNDVKLDKCLLNLNIDDISYKEPYIQTSNVNYKRNRVDTTQTFTIISEKLSKGYLFTSFWEIWGNNVENPTSITWVRNKFEKSMGALGYKFQDAGCCPGEDSRAFDYVGIPYISLSSWDPESNDDKANTSNDIYSDSFIENINLNGKIASKILLI